MTCFAPLTGYKSAVTGKTGKRQLVFNPAKGFRDLPVSVPCGQCVGCRIDKAGAWAVRCIHEAQMHEVNVFITLTYSDDNLPLGNTLVKKHLQDFWKRLRKHGPFRYYACAEYSDDERPHYHAILFGIDFADKKRHSKNAQGDQLWTSEKLDALWGFGHCWIGAVNIKSAGYVARYVMKKVTGELGEAYYAGREPPRTFMSLKPAIGSTWFAKFHKDVFPSDYVIVQGKKKRTPSFYTSRLTELDQKEIKHQRIIKSLAHKKDQTPERLNTRRLVLESKLATLKRS